MPVMIYFLKKNLKQISQDIVFLRNGCLFYLISLHVGIILRETEKEN
jgi:hypothetical protein